MKKRFISVLLAFTLILTLSLNVFAEETSDRTDIIYLADGSYITITINESTTRASGTKSGSKTYTYTASDDTVSWKAVVTGTFTYNGTTATCTAANCDVTIYDNVWYLISKAASKSNNTANASVTMGRKFLGITIAKETYDLSLSCDKNGNLS